MSDHKLAEALRACLDVLNELPTWSNAGHAMKLGNEALAAHEAEQQAGEAVAIVELKTCGGNAGLSTRIKEIEDPMRDRLTAGTKLFTHPQQPLTEEPAAWINWSALTGEPRLGWQCESEIASEPLYRKAKP